VSRPVPPIPASAKLISYGGNRFGEIMRVSRIEIVVEESRLGHRLTLREVVENSDGMDRKGFAMEVEDRMARLAAALKGDAVLELLTPRRACYRVEAHGDAKELTKIVAGWLTDGYQP